MNKEIYLQHVQEEGLKILLVKILDKVEIVLKNHEVKTTDFLNPYEVKVTTKILRNFQDVNYIVAGGYDSAERSIIIMFPDYLQLDDIDIPLTALEITGNLKFKTLNHRDYLGSILSLGIKREKIGDILIHDDCCQLIVQNDLKDFLKFNLQKVSNTTIAIKEIDIEDIMAVEINYTNISGTVASLRVDSILGLGFKVSRSEAQSLISKERVYINWGITTKKFQEISVDDVISVRGKGRIIIEDIQGTSRSGRIHVKLKKPI